MTKNMSMDITTKSGINRDEYAQPYDNNQYGSYPYYDQYETIEGLVYLNIQRGEQTQC